MNKVLYMLNVFEKKIHFLEIKEIIDFPGSPVVRTVCFHCVRHRFDP